MADAAAKAKTEEAPPVSRAPSANSNLAIRLATAAVGAPLIVALLYKGPPWGFYLLVLPATLIAAWELFNMTHPEDRLSQGLGVLVTAIVSAVIYFFGA